MKRIQTHWIWLSGIALLLTALVVRPFASDPLEANAMLLSYRLAIAGLLTFVAGVFFARNHLSLKLRHGLLAFGCVLNALLLSISLAFLPYPSAGYDLQILLLAACLWPGWGYVLWKFGWRNKLAVAVPLILGLLALGPIFGVILGALLIAGGAHT